MVSPSEQIDPDASHQRFESQTSRQQCKAHDSARNVKRARTPARGEGGTLACGQVYIGDVQVSLPDDLRQSADVPQEFEGAVIAAHQGVLTIVHFVSRGRIMKRSSASTQALSRLAYEHTLAAIADRYGRGQPGDTTPDDNGLGSVFAVPRLGRSR